MHSGYIKLKYSGDITVSGYCQAKNTEISGKITINNDAKINNIDCSGNFTILGNLKFDNVFVSGDFTSYKNVTGENIKLHGDIVIKNELCAEDVTIKSNSVEINELHANKVIIKKPFTINFLKKGVYIDEIECTTIEAENLNCKKLCAHDIKLTKKCEINVLEYSGTLQIENGCVVKEIIKL